jgi:hypothetical protein
MYGVWATHPPFMLDSWSTAIASRYISGNHFLLGLIFIPPHFCSLSYPPHARFELSAYMRHFAG